MGTKGERAGGGRGDALADGGSWDGLVVFCAATSWDGNRFPDQHMAERLAKYAPVLYVDPALSVMALRRDPALRASMHDRPYISLIGPSFARVTPIAPPGISRPGGHALAVSAVRRAIRRSVRRLHARVHATVIAYTEPLFGAAGEGVRVLYGTDDFVAGAKLMGLPARRLERSETKRLHEANLAFAVSEPLAARWREAGAEVHFLPNGVDDEMFGETDRAPDPTDVQLPTPIAGFIGHLSDRIDIKLLEAVAEGGHSLLLVGGRQRTFEMPRIERLFSYPNVQWVGAKPFGSLPSYLKMIDVGLVPYTKSQFNQASFPLKTLEYLAGGRAAVSTSLPAVRWLGTDLVTLADKPRDFASAVGHALTETRSPQLVAARQAVARRHSWTSRARQFAEVIGVREANF